MAIRIVLGGDHAGVGLKAVILTHLTKLGHVVTDKGTNTADSVDYPDHAHAVANAIADGAADLGILICGSGNGVNMVANRHRGVRAALAWQPELAKLAREHNNANVLSLPARFITEQMATEIVDAFLAGSFEGGRHQRRVDKIES